MTLTSTVDQTLTRMAGREPPRIGGEANLMRQNRSLVTASEPMIASLSQGQAGGRSMSRGRPVRAPAKKLAKSGPMALATTSRSSRRPCRAVLE